ncbi:MAG: hypothetical protein ACRD21_17425 [Vicinamibacteria bacterium]
MSASVTYASMNCGYFAANMSCLTKESGGAICIPAYPANAPQFLAGDLARGTPYLKSGYTRDYQSAGPAPVASPNCDPASIIDYCYISFPASPGMSGVRSFAGGSTGAMFMDPTGAPLACPVPLGTPTIN